MKHFFELSLNIIEEFIKRPDFSNEHDSIIFESSDDKKKEQYFQKERKNYYDTGFMRGFIIGGVVTATIGGGLYIRSRKDSV